MIRQSGLHRWRHGQGTCALGGRCGALAQTVGAVWKDTSARSNPLSSMSSQWRTCLIDCARGGWPGCACMDGTGLSREETHAPGPDQVFSILTPVNEIQAHAAAQHADIESV